jgi:hypothetical protein
MRYRFLRSTAVALWLASEATRASAVIDTTRQRTPNNDATGDGRPARKPAPEPPSKCFSLQGSGRCAIDVRGTDPRNVNWANITGLGIQLVVRNADAAGVAPRAANHTRRVIS